MKRAEFYAMLQGINRTEVIEKHGSYNTFLIETYKAQTGASEFHKFKEWREKGFRVKKGESSFPVFSRPLSVLKQEKGKEVGDNDLHHFGVCHLFHEGQVEPIPAKGAKKEYVATESDIEESAFNREAGYES